MTKEFASFFTQLWFSSKETDIFLTLYKLGTQPASAIAKHTGIERTLVYKILLDMTKKNLVKASIRRGVKQFFIPSPAVIQQYITDQQSHREHVQNDFVAIEHHLEQLAVNRYPHLPKISFFDGFDGVRNMYADLYQEVKINKYLAIKLFATNTFASQVSVDNTLKNYATDMFQKLQKRKVTIETYLWDGILIMEHISKTTNIANLETLPAGNAAINIFVVGKIVYIVIFKDIPFAIKLASEDLAYAMHFLFEKLQVD